MKEIDTYSLPGFPDLFGTHSPAPLPFTWFLHIFFFLPGFFSFLCSMASIMLHIHTIVKNMSTVNISCKNTFSFTDDEFVFFTLDFTEDFYFTAMAPEGYWT